ncbi:hypothetical protein L873DRAFT_1151082 [Choiromyces venosus 120613-1]|uniref:Uncharacterized protein n=1 Tax=Choiromyces venosus 120613-1 TaxID=1336337 RepID=A0A3N4JFV0_9PEZI|nr:hypothetical protein L873DRAFT_1151082 [Choiromyces venosus 120613-1]
MVAQFYSSAHHSFHKVTSFLPHLHAIPFLQCLYPWFPPFPSLPGRPSLKQGLPCQQNPAKNPPFRPSNIRAPFQPVHNHTPHPSIVNRVFGFGIRRREERPRARSVGALICVFLLDLDLWSCLV